MSKIELNEDCTEAFYEDKYGDTLAIQWGDRIAPPVLNVNGQEVAVEMDDLIDTLTTMRDAATGLKPSPDPVQVKVTEDPWLEVVPRSRAALVTEEFVRNMGWHGGSAIRPRFHERTGEPLGVEYGRDDVKQIPIGDYVILEPGGVVSSIWEDYFNEHYRKVQA